MRPLFALGLLVTVLVTLSQIQTSESFKWRIPKRNAFTIMRHTIQGVQGVLHEVKRERRQSLNPRCIAAASKVGEDKFRNCEKEYELLGDDTELNKFCRMNCTGVMDDIYIQLRDYCGDNIPNINTALIQFIEQTCDHDPHRRYCAHDWYHAESLFPESDKNDYSTCLSTYQPGQCPAACKQPLKDINDQFGCCYAALYSYTQQDSNGTGLLPLNAFNDCGLSTPSLCTS